VGVGISESPSHILCIIRTAAVSRPSSPLSLPLFHRLPATHCQPATTAHYPIIPLQWAGYSPHLLPTTPQTLFHCGCTHPFHPSLPGSSINPISEEEIAIFHPTIPFPTPIAPH